MRTFLRNDFAPQLIDFHVISGIDNNSMIRNRFFVKRQFYVYFGSKPVYR